MASMDKKSVYLETSFISYLTSRPSRDLVAAGHQAITQEWWEIRRQDFDLFISEVVVDEARDGHPEAAARRLAVLESLPLAEVTEGAIALGEQLLQQQVVPAKAATDALHMGVACDNGIDYLLTWNCKHIANAEQFHEIERVCKELGYSVPIICTPEELLGEG